MNLNFSALIPTCLSLLLLIAVGFVLRKIGLLDEDFSKKLSSLVTKVAMPFLIVHSIISLEFSKERLLRGLLILAFGTAAHVFMALAAKLIFFRTKNIDEKKIFEFASVFSNCAFIGYPILGALFGEIGLFYGAFYVVTYNLGCWSYGAMIMAKGKPGYRLSLKTVFFNIGTVSCFLGLIIYILQLPMPVFLQTTAAHLGGLCTPLSLLVTGSLLAALPLGKTFTNARIYLFCAVKLVVLPLLFALILHLIGVDLLLSDINLTVFLAVMVALPPAAMTSLFSNMYDVKPSFAAQTVSIGTLLSPLTTLLVIKITQIICLI